MPPESEAVLSRTVFLSGQLSGAAKVMDANGNLIADLSADEGGFIAGVARVLDRERAKHKKPLDGAVIVTLGANGRLSITDPSTGWSADLMGFGADNAKAFAKLLAQNPKGN
jgi:putative photosynthetic complex assembly protein